MTNSKEYAVDGSVYTRQEKPFRLIVLINVVIFLSSCSPDNIKTGLFDTAQHTGTVTVYRVGKLSQDNDNYKPRFTQLYNKDHIEAVLNPQAIVTADDMVTVSLDYAFIKYFKETGDSYIDVDKEFDTEPYSSDRKGEIVVVLSFDAGTDKKESLVVFSSKGQTLGSMLSLSDWPMIGPLKIDGDGLLVRIVMIERSVILIQDFPKFILNNILF